MDKTDVIAFFNRCAPTWDAETVKNDEIIERILDNTIVGADMKILDVACGTGVMFDYYLKRNVSSVTGIDISPEMARLAAAKYESTNNLQVICGDVEEYTFENKFDRIVIYNAFPHFPCPERLIQRLSALLKVGGRLTVAHGDSRDAIDRHHNAFASKVSTGLMSAENLKQIFDKYLDVDVVISDQHMYQVCGTKRSDK